MSTVVLALCWPLRLPPTPKSVLISLADNANDQGECFPSIDTICTRTCFGRTAVIDAIAFLEAQSLLVADRSNGRHTRYRITVPGMVPDGVRPVRLPNRSASRTGTPAGPVDAANQSACRTQPVRQADTNRQEPKALQAKALGTDGTSPSCARMREAAIRPSDPPEAEEQGAGPDVHGLCVEYAQALIAAGVPPTRVNPSHAELVQLAAAGVPAVEVRDAALECVAAGKTHLAYIARMVAGRRRDAAAHAAVPAAGPPRQRREDWTGRAAQRKARSDPKAGMQQVADIARTLGLAVKPT